MTTPGAVIAAGNEAQAAMWDGDEGVEWASDPEFYDRCIQRHHARLMGAAEISEGDRVLDIGCGNGQTTRDAARAAASGRALGIDLSSQMIERARTMASAEGVANATFVRGDAEVFQYERAGYDVAISRFGAMFFADPIAAFTNIASALRPGGRTVLLTWQPLSANAWLQEVCEALSLGRPLPFPPADVPGPFGLAGLDRITTVFAEASCDVVVDPVEEPMYYGADADEAFAALSKMWGWLTAEHTDDERGQAMRNLRASIDAHASPQGVLYDTRAWLITARPQ